MRSGSSPTPRRSCSTAFKAADIPSATELFALSATEAQVVGSLGKGEGLWLVGGRFFRIQHVVSGIGWALVQSDRAMLDTRPTVLDRHATGEPVDGVDPRAGDRHARRRPASQRAGHPANDEEDVMTDSEPVPAGAALLGGIA